MPNNKRTSAPNAVAEADFDPATVNARLWLEAHCLQKSAQLGSVASLPVLAGAALAGRLGRTSPLNTAGAFRVLAASSSLIFVVLAAATSYKVVGLDLEGVQERVYRLHYNAGQARADKLSNALGCLGAGLAVAVSAAPPLSALVGGFAAGTAAGLAAHVATKPKPRE